MGRVTYPAIGETSDHPDVDRQSKPHNFRFSLLLFVKVRREQVWLTFYIPWKNQFVNRNIARPFLSSRENVFFSRLALTEKADQCSDWQFVSFHRSLYRAVVDTPAHSATTPLTQRHSLLRLSVLWRGPPWTGTDSEIWHRENKRRKWVPPKLGGFYRSRNWLLRLQLDVEDQTLR